MDYSEKLSAHWLVTINNASDCRTNGLSG